MGKMDDTDKAIILLGFLSVVGLLGFFAYLAYLKSQPSPVLLTPVGEVEAVKRELGG